MDDENPIFEEIRRTRERMLARHNGNVDALVGELQRLSAQRPPADPAATDSGRPAPATPPLPKKAG